LNATDIGIKTIFIQGIGEPLLNKSLPDAIAAGGESDIKMCLVTNGVLLDKSKQEKILNNLVFVKFSVLDNDPKRYAKTHGCPENQFNKLVENIENAIDFRSMNNLDVTLWASVYVDIDNFSDIYDIVKFSKSLGLDFVTISQATYTEFTPHGRKEILVDDSFSKEEIDELIEKILSLNDDKFVSHIQFPLERYFSSKRWGLNYCRAVNLITAISGDGEVYPCWRFWGRKEYSYGSLYEKSFEEIWRGKRRKEINEYLYATPPEKDECEVCKCITVNDNLDKLLNNHNKWTDIL
jgi:radical SAM protein with 4Fe4S-binding SPASM domain